MNGDRVTRRTFMRHATVVTAGVAAGASLFRSRGAHAEGMNPVVETSYGKVRGFVDEGC